VPLIAAGGVKHGEAEMDAKQTWGSGSQVCEGNANHDRYVQLSYVESYLAGFFARLQRLATFFPDLKN
jgi:hypothetical protein